jgi:hypothetical protein
MQLRIPPVRKEQNFRKPLLNKKTLQNRLNFTTEDNEGDKW